MITEKIHFHAKPWSKTETVPASTDVVTPELPRLEPSTCTEAETFALRVLDDSMQPEFRKGCIIIIDPTGHARDGSYVLARMAVDSDSHAFRQLRRTQDNQRWVLAALNEQYPYESTAEDLSEIVGVIVQRAGTRRRYHKHYN